MGGTQYTAVVAVDQWFLSTADGASRLYVREVGPAGSPVVVLHGGPGADYTTLWTALAPHVKDHRLVFFDQRGSLRSPAKLDDVCFPKLVDDLGTLHDALGTERVHLIAHSAGAVLALAYLAARPGRVGGVVLLSPHPRMIRPELPDEAQLHQEQYERRQEFIGRPAVAAEMAKHGVETEEGLDPRASMVRWRIQLAAANSYRIDRWHVDPWPGHSFYKDDIGSRVADSMPSDFDPRPAMTAHDQPISIVLGDHDFADMGARTWRRRMPLGKVQLHVLPRAGHNAWVDRPVLFRRLVSDLLAQITATKG